MKNSFGVLLVAFLATILVALSSVQGQTATVFVNTSTNACNNAECPPLLAGLPLAPICYLGGQLTHDTSLLGQLSPGLSIIQNTVPDALHLVNTAASKLLSSVFPLGVDLQFQMNLSSDCSNLTSQLLSPISGVVATAVQSNLPSNLLENLLDTGALFCSVAPGCSVNISSVLLNGVKISSDVTMIGAALGSSLNSINFQNTDLLSCGWNLTMNVHAQCEQGQLLRTVLQSVIDRLTADNPLLQDLMDHAFAGNYQPLNAVVSALLSNADVMQELQITLTGGLLGDSNLIAELFGPKGLFGSGNLITLLSQNNGLLNGLTGANGVLNGVTGSNGALNGVTGNNGVLNTVTGSWTIKRYYWK